MSDAIQSPLQKARIFLRYGYLPFPDWEALAPFASAEFAALRQELEASSRAALRERLWGAALTAFEGAFADRSSDLVIPLSGGRDSRLILCMAAEFGLCRQVTAVTWGVPGSLDFRIAREVATHVGVRHLRINTAVQAVTFGDLKRAYVRGAPWTDLMMSHFNQAWRTLFPGTRAVIGYLGGPPMGCHYAPQFDKIDFDGAVAVFEAFNQRSKRGASAIGDVRDRLIDPALMTLPEQLDLVYRQAGYLHRVLAPARLPVSTPFAHPEWMQLTYALPARCRLGSNLYSEFLIERFPRAFAIGTSGSYGRRANAGNLEKRAGRQLVRLSHMLANLGRSREFATLDKYGDQRDLCAILRGALAGGAPDAYQRRLRRRRRDWSAREAGEWRRMLMLIANLACERADGAQPRAAARLQPAS